MQDFCIHLLILFISCSPEACAAILWKSSQAAPKAAEKLKITAPELCKLKIADGIIPEPLGGAHTDPAWTSQQIKIAVTKAMEELAEMDTESLLNHRHLKFRKLGGFIEGGSIEPEKKKNMKKQESNLSQSTAEIELEIEKLKKAALESKGKTVGPTFSSEAVERLKQDVDKEMTDAFISMGLQEKLESLKMEISKLSPSDSPDQTLTPALKEKSDKLMQEFKHNLSQPGSYLGLKQKLKMLAGINELLDRRTKGERLKNEINEKLRDQVKGKIEFLKIAREKVAKGEKLDEDELKEVTSVQEELKEMLKSLNLEVVGFGKKIVPTSPPVLEEKLNEADEIVKMEIVNAIDKAGLSGKIEELKAEIARGASKETVESLAKDIREAIVSSMDLAEVKRKVASTVGLPEEEVVHQ